MATEARKAYIKKYQREWMRKRRQAWFDQAGPCQLCGSTENLELDHINPSTKVHHAIWSWSDKRRLEELAKCRPLCESCHKEKTKTEMAKGEDNSQATRTNALAADIRSRYAAGERQCDIARDLELDKRFVSAVVLRKTYKYV